jgi:C-terminal processing protease CtpA/Prc
MLIHSIDGLEIRQLELDQVVALLKGQPGSMVVIRVSSHLEALRPSTSPLTSFTEEAKEATITKFKECVFRKDFEVIVFRCIQLVESRS